MTITKFVSTYVLAALVAVGSFCVFSAGGGGAFDAVPAGSGGALLAPAARA